MASIIFNNYDILVEVIKCIPENQVLVVIKDKGVGISSEDLPYIANIGSSADNEHKRKLMKNMPEWLQPSGLFGIGLQSVFQIADCIEFYTRQHNRPERRIALYSYGRNHGRIEVTEVVPEEDLVYYTNSIPGTNAKIIINPDKIYIDETEDTFFDSHKEKPKLLYFDNDFHNKCRLDIIFNEICEACKAVIRSSPSDYFRIRYQEIIQTTNKESGEEDNDKHDLKILRNSYFINPEDLSKSDTGSKSSSSNKGSKNSQAKSKFVYGDNCIPYLRSKGKSMVFSGTTAFYWDNESSTAYHLTIRPCKITNIQNNGQVFLPRRTKDLYKIHYKFNTLSKTDSIYSFTKEDIQSHAGFISWNIYIFNNKQTKYLNIDRDQLKKSALTEDELLQIRSKMIVEWCEYLIDANGHPDVDFKNAEYLLHNDDNILLSLLILFYQCCERNQFDRFVEKYGENISGRGLVIGHENIFVTDLWNDSKRFL